MSADDRRLTLAMAKHNVALLHERYQESLKETQMLLKVWREAKANLAGLKKRHRELLAEARA